MNYGILYSLQRVGEQIPQIVDNLNHSLAPYLQPGGPSISEIFRDIVQVYHNFRACCNFAIFCTLTILGYYALEHYHKNRSSHGKPHAVPMDDYKPERPIVIRRK